MKKSLTCDQGFFHVLFVKEVIDMEENVLFIMIPHDELLVEWRKSRLTERIKEALLEVDPHEILLQDSPSPFGIHTPRFCLFDVVKILFFIYTKTYGVFPYSPKTH